MIILIQVTKLFPRKEKKDSPPPPHENIHNSYIKNPATIYWDIFIIQSHSSRVWLYVEYFFIHFHSKNN